MKLEAIEFKNRWWLILVVIPIHLTLFLGCFIIYAVSFAPNRTAFYLTFIVFIIAVYISVRLMATKYRFIRMGEVRLNGNAIFISRSNKSIPIEENSVLTVSYAGDKQWKSSFKLLMYLKQSFRYNNLWYYPYQSSCYDFLDIDGKKVYIKIKNDRNKKISLSL